MPLRSKSASAALAAAALAPAALLAACNKPKPPPPPPPYNLSLDMKEVMGHVVDPGAWAFWKASGDEESASGDKSLAPTTEEGWDVAESGAAQVAEAGNLLLIPGRSRPEPEWTHYAQEMTRLGLEGKAAAEAHDTKKMFVAGAAIYQVCTGCHAKYVIPAYIKIRDKTKYPGLPAWPADVMKRQEGYRAVHPNAPAPDAMGLPKTAAPPT